MFEDMDEQKDPVVKILIAALKRLQKQSKKQQKLNTISIILTILVIVLIVSIMCYTGFTMYQYYALAAVSIVPIIFSLIFIVLYCALIPDLQDSDYETQSTCGPAYTWSMIILIGLLCYILVLIVKGIDDCN